MNIIKEVHGRRGTEITKSNYSEQWRLFDELLDDREFMDEKRNEFFSTTMLKPDDICGRRVLEIGCGPGFHTKAISECNPEKLIAIDLASVEQARKMVKDYENVHVMQEDVFSLPFKEESFDIVIAIYTLMHTKHPPKAFEKAAKMVKKGGVLCTWFYGRMPVPQNIVNNVIRSITTKMPIKVVWMWAGLLSMVGSIPKTGFVMMLSYHKNKKFRRLQIFDWYHPPYQYKYSTNEILEWYRESGFNEVTLTKNRGFRGIK